MVACAWTRVCGGFTGVLSPETVLAGRYRILSIVGEGRFGKVYLGYDLRIDRHVAIKELLPHSTVLSTEDGD